WKGHFNDFTRALYLLEEGMASDIPSLSQLAKEGLVRRFTFTLELAWKTVKDFLEESGLQLTVITPREVIKAARSAGVVSDGELWMVMLDHRNMLSHTYDVERFEEALTAISRDYLATLRSLHVFLGSQ
ncbi:MAG: nucleotidyltransferase substrate binding protein, partial [Candidatus Kapaibacterium sp.]